MNTKPRHVLFFPNRRLLRNVLPRSMEMLKRWDRSLRIQNVCPIPDSRSDRKRKNVHWIESGIALWLLASCWFRTGFVRFKNGIQSGRDSGIAGFHRAQTWLQRSTSTIECSSGFPWIEACVDDSPEPSAVCGVDHGHQS